MILNLVQRFSVLPKILNQCHLRINANKDELKGNFGLSFAKKM
jgi:hypothetical protein